MTEKYFLMVKSKVNNLGKYLGKYLDLGLVKLKVIKKLILMVKKKGSNLETSSLIMKD